MQVSASVKLAIVGTVGLAFLAGCGANTTTLPLQNNATGVAVSPSIAAVGVSGTQQFTATVSPTGANQAVAWSVSGSGCSSGASCGTIDATGKYIAPLTLPSPATVMVSATSVADPTKAAAATVALFSYGAFAPIGNMTVARADHSATLLPDGRVLIAGGVAIASALQPPLASAELYDPSTHNFTPTGSMITPRYAQSATLLADGRVLIVGGTQDVNSTSYVLSAEIYDPSTGAFTSTGDLSSIGGSVLAVTGPVTALLPDGRVFVAAAGNAEIYDPGSGTFTLTGPYVDPGPILIGTVTLLTSGNVLITGCNALCSAGVAELFDPQTGAFGVTGPMPGYSWIDVNTATLLTNGKVLLVGNEENDGSSADAELYDPAAGIFASIGSTIAPHEYAAAVRLADGTVLITGGQLIGGDASQASDFYLPSTGTFASAGIMTVGRDSHTATLLQDGTVLITGGFSTYPAATSSAEIYKKPSAQ